METAEISERVCFSSCGDFPQPKSPVRIARRPITIAAFPRILLRIAVVKGIAALGAELRGIFRVLRLPAALVTAIMRSSLRLLRAAVLAELALVYGAAGTSPAILVRRLFCAAFGTEFAGSRSSAGALPCACLNWLRLFCAAFGTELALYYSSAGALPALHAFVISRLLCLLPILLLLLTHCKQILRVHAAGVHSHAHAHKACHGASLV